MQYYVLTALLVHTSEDPETFNNEALVFDWSLETLLATPWTLSIRPQAER